MKWIKAIMDIYCLIQGFQVKKLTTKKELKTAFDLKNRINQSLSDLPPLAEKDEFIYPEGLAYTIGVFHKKQLIGTISLMDLTQTDCYTAKAYANATLDYEPQKTYEVKSFVVDTNYQHGIGGVFNVLIFYAIFFSERSRRNQWLVLTSNIFYKKIKQRSGLPTELISDSCSYVIDNSVQSRYLQNYMKLDLFQDYTCYYIKIPKGILMRLTFKFLRMSVMKSLKRIPLFSSFQKRKTALAQS
jgi:hypothetical protein